MSLIGMQTAIARLCVDEPFRFVFIQDPDEALASYELTENERTTIAELNLTDVVRYADSLMTKRFGLIRKWFPIAFTALRKEVDAVQRHQILARFAREFVRNGEELGGEWVRGESGRFCTYMTRLVHSGELPIPYIPDVFEFERTRQLLAQDHEAWESSRQAVASRTEDLTHLRAQIAAGGALRLADHVRIRQFAYDMNAVISAIESDGPPPRPAISPTWVLFLKRAKGINVHAQSISPSLRTLLALCDGTRAAAAVVETVITSARELTDATTDEVRSDSYLVIEQCCAAGIVVVEGTMPGAIAIADAVLRGSSRDDVW